MAEEEWRPVGTHVDSYEVSDLGRVRSLDRTIQVRLPSGQSYLRKHRGRILRPQTSAGGYQTVFLWTDYTARQAAVHWLVLEAFVGERPLGHYGCHRDGKRKHNALGNLYWGTPTENSGDKLKHGTHLDGERIPHAKLKSSDVIEIRKLAGSVLQSDLAARFGVQQNTISRIQNHSRWKDRSGTLHMGMS